MQQHQPAGADPHRQTVVELNGDELGIIRQQIQLEAVGRDRWVPGALLAAKDQSACVEDTQLGSVIHGPRRCSEKLCGFCFGVGERTGIPQQILKHFFREETRSVLCDVARQCIDNALLDFER